MELLKKAGIRFTITLLLLILQIIGIVILASIIVDSLPVIFGFSWILGMVIVFLLVRKDEPSPYKTIWIIIVMGWPFIGGLLYLIFEENPHIKRVDARINKEHSKLSNLLCEYNENFNDINTRADSRVIGCSRYIKKASSYHSYRNTESKYYPMGELMFEDMLASMRNAEKFIFVEYFIITQSTMWDKTLEILEQKAAEGVDVRLIFDDFGSNRLFTGSYMKGLKKKGIKAVRFNPMSPVLSLFMNNRNHRKILVIDGHTAFNGGINISDEYININCKFGIWKDGGVRLRGEAVTSFSHMFIKIWNTFCKAEEYIADYMSYKNHENSEPLYDGLIVPYDDSPLSSEQIGENVYIDILNKAQSYVYIFTPFLIISEKMIYALKMAAMRGVDVRIITPGIPESKMVHRLTRSYYAYLLQSGVRIYEYTPGFLHAKTFVSDEEIAVVGTINLDYRSLYLHFECATLLYNSSSIKDIKEDFVRTIDASKEVLPADTRRRVWDKFIDALLRLLAPLM